MAVYVVGLQHHEYAIAAGDLEPGDEVQLVLEPENVHDRKAIAVYDMLDRRLGYIPRVNNEVLSVLLAAGYGVEAYVLTHNTAAPALGAEARRLQIAVYLPNLNIIDPRRS